MTSAPNVNTLWGRVMVEELVAVGVDTMCVAPGSRSTPIVVAAAEHPEIEICSILDERSMAYFALGRGKRTGRPTPVVTTSGTAAAELHPAILEADQARVPFLALTGDRPPVLRDSGSNQTVDQQKLYGDAVRWYREFPEPGATDRKLRRLRTDVARAISSALGPPAGPVHCNVPFSKPLAPTETADGPVQVDSPRDDPYVAVSRGVRALDPGELAPLQDALEAADRGLIVCGPADPGHVDPVALQDLADAAGFPLVADPLSGLRFGEHVAAAEVPVLGGYDAYLVPELTDDRPDPDVVVRVGASPTSKRLRRYLYRSGATQFVIDPSGGWRVAEFDPMTVLVGDPTRVARSVADRVDATASASWLEWFRSAERTHWELAMASDLPFEGSVLTTVVESTPAPATITVSNSMPVRDLDRFGPPSAEPLTLLGNRGTSGIDGVTSTTIGAGHASAGSVVGVLGDLAFHHDMNGMLAAVRCGVEPLLVVINNDGGGIFHKLPIAEFDPPFTEHFRTPHGLDFRSAADQYGFEYRTVDPAGFEPAYVDMLDGTGRRLLEVRTDAERSHTLRNRLEDDLLAAMQ